MRIKEFNELPLSARPLSEADRDSILIRLDPLIKYALGSPGDWGYETKLGQMTLMLKQLREEIVMAGNESTECSHG